MIKFFATRDGRTCLGLIVTKENIDLLIADKPLFLHAESMNRETFNVQDVFVMYAVDDKAGIDMLEGFGVLKDAIIKTDSPN